MMEKLKQKVLKGQLTPLALNFWLFLIFPLFVNDTVMFQYLRQEIKRKRTYEVDKNIFILEPEPILSKKGAYSSCEQLYLSRYQST